MPFWKKSEDPWDYEPEKPSRPAEPGQEEKDCAPSLMDELPGLERGAEGEEGPAGDPAPAHDLSLVRAGDGGGDDHWGTGQCPVVARLPNRFFGASGPEIDILHEGSLFNRYKTAWLCRGCRRMVMEIPEEEIPKPLTSEKAAEQLEEQRRREAQRKIDRGLQG